MDASIYKNENIQIGEYQPKNGNKTRYRNTETNNNGI